MVKLLKDQEHQSQTSRRRLSCSTQSQSKSDEVEDRGKSFTQEDYKNAMTYLKDSKNYTALFGDGSKTSVRVKLMTKSQAFEVFATWLNQLNSDLLLNGRRLQQRIDWWKKKYMDVRMFEENTGAGIKNDSGQQALYDLLESKCPCYPCLDVPWQSKCHFSFRIQPFKTRNGPFSFTIQWRS